MADDKSKEITIDRELCTGCQHCVGECPEVFKFDDAKNIAKVVKQECKNCNIDDIIDACPVGAISRK